MKKCVVLTIFICLCLALAGCGKRQIEAEKWFPFESGKRWKVVKKIEQSSLEDSFERSAAPNDSAALPFCTPAYASERITPQNAYPLYLNSDSISVMDVVKSGDSISATLALKDRSERVPPSMKFTADEKALSINFLLNPDCDMFDVPVQLDPAMPVLRMPLLSGDSWEWHGDAICIDPRDNEDTRFHAKGSAGIRVEHLDSVTINDKEYKNAACSVMDFNISAKGETIHRIYRLTFAQGKGLILYEVFGCQYDAAMEISQRRAMQYFEPAF